jgi:tetratricopeptide (TPR) repeat protein
MHSRFALRTLVVLLVGTVAAAGCGRYSYGNLKAKKSLNEAHVLYSRGEFKQAAVKYEEVVSDPAVVERDPAMGAAYFYLGNSYDNLYKPARKGEAENDANLQKAVENYTLAAEKAGDPLIRKRAFEYLVAAYAPDKMNTPEKSEPLVLKMIEAEPTDPANYHVLGKVYEDSAQLEKAEAAYRKAIELNPSNSDSYQILSGFFNRQGDFENTVATMAERARIDSDNPEAFHQMSVWYWEKVDKDYTLSRAKKLEYLKAGLAAEERALSINPEYFEAIVYKGLLLRQQALLETNRATQAALIKEADALQQKAIAIQKKKASGG